MKTGRIHSIESMGLVDGPGIRTVVFFQGCKLRCAYCHNPDTWNLKDGKEVTSEEIINKIIRFKPYFQPSGGGITFSGGDPLVQPEFLLELLKKCKELGIHTAIDTAGYGHGDYDEILKYTDLVLLDRKSKARVWVRHVVVPGYTDTLEHMDKIASIINEEIPNVDKIELLPYHLLGVNKYESLSIDYRLDGVNQMDKETCSQLQDYLISKVQQIKRSKIS